MYRSGADGVMDSPGEQRGGVPALRGPGLLRMCRKKASEIDGKGHGKGHGKVMTSRFQDILG